MQLIKKLLLFVLLLGMVAGTLAGCATDTNNVETVNISTLADLETGKIGIVTGTNWDNVAKTKFPNAERKYFSSGADAILAVEQGKVDAFFADKTVYAGMRWENDAITYIDEPLEPVSNALILTKEGYDEKLFSEINEFVAKTKADGTLERLDEKWFGDSEPEEHPDYTKLEGENGTIKIAIGDTMKPTSYQKGILFTGYEVDFLTLFAKEYGYKLDIQGMAFDALIPTISSGKCDVGAAGITITPERAQSVTFSDSHFETYGVAIVKNNASLKKKNIKSEKDLKNGKIAILTGSILDVVVKERLPEAELKYFSTIPDMILSLSQGKADAMIGDETFYLNARWENVPVKSIGEPAGNIPCGIILSKTGYDEKLLSQLNEFITKIKEDGTADKLLKKWICETEPTEFPDYASLSGENGTLKVAVNDTGKPMTYVKNGGFTGFDIEVITEFAREYGYNLEFSGMTFDAVIPTVSSGKCDLGICGIAITPEREESVTFTDTYIEKHGMFIVYDSEETVAQSTFIDGIKESFEKTFIRENRWKLIAEGLIITIIISLLAMLIGSLLGFGLYMLGRSDIKLVQTIVKAVGGVYSRIIAGTPVVVILMILFYVIFGKFRDISGILVAIIGFSLTFGAFVYDHMAVSVNSVDLGQTEAAYALGYSKNKTFFRIILPQAMTIFMPSYCGEVVSLIKATAVVGYIAVNDLTKMGDIIRSNTYEAFFPLIATAVIYFVLTWIVASLLNIVKHKFEPKRRKENTILKGVKR